jgi:hypothetical protein
MNNGEEGREKREWKRKFSSYKEWRNSLRKTTRLEKELHDPRGKS